VAQPAVPSPIVVQPVVPTATLLPFPMIVDFEMADAAQFNPKLGRYVAMACSEARVAFINLSSGGSGRFYWDFGGRNRSREVNPILYFAPGQPSALYTITLTALANDGSSQSVSKQLEVRYDQTCTTIP
jgi:hypothetical protein